MYKTCRGCGQEKPLTDYSLNRGSPRPRCKPCRSRETIAWQKQNPQKARDKHERWRRKRGIKKFTPATEEQKRKTSQRARRKWVAHHPDKNKECKKRWVERNPGAVTARVRRYQAAKRNAVPQWANHKKIRAIYDAAQWLTVETGKPHEVDHIIPLLSDRVCGLHCEANLRVLPRRLNRLKSNKVDFRGVIHKV